MREQAELAEDFGEFPEEQGRSGNRRHRRDREKGRRKGRSRRRRDPFADQGGLESPYMRKG